MKNNNPKKINLLFRVFFSHGICWALFIAYELGTLYYARGKLESFDGYALYYLVNILLFYGQAALLSFTFQPIKGRYGKGLLLFIALLFTYVSIKFCAFVLLDHSHPHVTKFEAYLHIIPSVLYRGTYFIILGTFYWAAGHISNFKKQVIIAEQKQGVTLQEKALLEIKLAASRNAYLKQQLNPHLLFNTLNFIYSSVYQESTTAAECVVLLADIMRYSLEESGEDGKVPLFAEAAQLERLIRINQFRYDQVLAVSFSIKEGLQNARIIPLILVTLAENVFKHGHLLDPGFPANITLSPTTDGRLRFSTQNRKKSPADRARQSSIGLQNTRIRLDYAYPEQYELDIIESASYYELYLTLPL